MGQVPALTMLAEVDELKVLLEQEWPARRAALRASGVPLMEDDPDPDPDPDPAPDPNQPPPWGDDFDPDRAWRLVQNLRTDQEKSKKQLNEALAKLQEREDADKSDQQRLEERANGAETRAVTAERELARTRVALRRGLTEAQAKRLIGDTEEELEADADVLLATFQRDDSDGQDPLRRTPRERLRPGATPLAEPEETDPAKLAAMVPRRF